MAFAFVELSPFLRGMHTELIPAHAKESGYDPKTHRQVIVVGLETELEAWRDQQGLLPEHYPIQPSSFGPHIDIYGNPAIETIIPQEEIMPDILYVRQLLLEKTAGSSSTTD